MSTFQTYPELYSLSEIVVLPFSRHFCLYSIPCALQYSSISPGGSWNFQWKYLCYRFSSRPKNAQHITALESRIMLLSYLPRLITCRKCSPWSVDSKIKCSADIQLNEPSGTWDCRSYSSISLNSHCTPWSFALCCYPIMHCGKTFRFQVWERTNFCR